VRPRNWRLIEVGVSSDAKLIGFFKRRSTPAANNCTAVAANQRLSHFFLTPRTIEGVHLFLFGHKITLPETVRELRIPAL